MRHLLEDTNRCLCISKQNNVLGIERIVIAAELFNITAVKRG